MSEIKSSYSLTYEALSKGKKGRKRKNINMTNKMLKGSLMLGQINEKYLKKANELHAASSDIGSQNSYSGDERNPNFRSPCSTTQRINKNTKQLSKSKVPITISSGGPVL